ncbi:pyrroloquinoline quinone biosynthesis protein PqqE [Tunturibacter empetritectus]|uniref:PqqA peptide cyclase n=1 Tax=Tunturiibacter empetritectus TaxID=3069691 RepID=A0A7W8MPE4_9BACT|nr:pyrroloquinoline quinone biosynthesis protein PqqE [Edaphobacter lichenicola]MBB5315596.1 pyrroloquinoline quinone biosynthesis protein E [Edaphobacter lichenicola]
MSTLPGPLSLVAEVTHRCPLHCVYCSNPLQMQSAANELSTDDWTRVFHQASELGVLHLHLTGGEPLSRPDIANLVDAGREANLYVNMITSGLGLTADRMHELKDAGLEHIQLSLQDADEEKANEFAGARAHAHKLKLAALIRQQDIAFTVNVVVHRDNLDRLEAILALAESLEPQRIEVAHVQYYGWALKNRDRLMPTPTQVERSVQLITEAQSRLSGRIQLQAVFPDYYARYPKTCVGGWGRQMMLIDPAGLALPCHAAAIIPGMNFDSVRAHTLEWLWKHSPAFNRFRGTDWMNPPCSTCDRREIDLGGCRCQAFQLTGDAANTDPACSLSDQHESLVAIAQARPSSDSQWVYRILAKS